ncbi:MAG TPA: hypothetical protein VHP14_23970, partial [Anaerolineales bacterium]|nr:hypothetical protein [Anaerolineales bacterium]
MSRKFGYVPFIVCLIATLGLICSKIPVVYADGSCSGTVVSGDGADCGLSGSTPGRGQEEGGNGGSEGSGQDGSSSSGNNQQHNTSNNGNESSCSPGTSFGQVNLYTPVDNLNLPVESMNFTLPDGSVVSGDQVPVNMCTIVSQDIDTCTGGGLAAPEGPIASNDGQFHVSECPSSYTTPPNPCNEFIAAGGGVTCTSDLGSWRSSSSSGSSWELRVHAGWPGNEIHTRPYPVTLVDWDSVLRVAGLGTSSGADRLGYA